ncbi:MAG: PKD domain-containing protein [Thermoplasmatota archaeon]
MHSKMRERIIVGVAAILFFAAFAAVAYFDRSHGTVGDDFGQDDFTADIEKNQGHLSIPSLPSDLLILGAGQETTLDFTVTNNDEDNDIDTIYISIPEADISGGTTTWYIPSFLHDWNYTVINNDLVKFFAKDDFPGRNFGSSAQYNVAGNIDDALDHSQVDGISEGLTIELDFTAPEDPGTRTGSFAINLQVADELTEPAEGSTPDKYSVEPFPYSYLVIDTDYEFIMFSLSGSNADIEIDYGDQRLFSTGTRASDFVSSEYGFKYTSETGEKVVILDAPEDEETVVSPIIKAVQDGGGTYTIDMVRFKTASMEPDATPEERLVVEKQQIDYTGDLPETRGESVSLDGDGDGLFLDNDDDWDNDGVDNANDTSPFDNTIINHRPTLDRIEPSATELSADKELTLTAMATDVDEGDQLYYIWTCEQLPGQQWTTRSIVLKDLEPGVYVFKVVVSDMSGTEVEDQITVTITEPPADETEFPTMLVVVAVALLLIFIAVVVYFVFIRKGEEEPMELPPEPGAMEAEPMAPPTPGYPMGYEEGEMVKEEYFDEAEEMEEEEIDYEMMEEEEEEAEALPAGEITIPGLPEESELQEVQDLEALIDEMERTEEEIGDMCPECGAPLGPYDTECSTCGAEFEVALECPNCGAVVEGDVDKCPSCGILFQ